jgi:YgiT-type zinc finger domain-containing protein
MELRFQKEEDDLECHVCGGDLNPIETDLPFKVDENSILILKALPVLQCENCREYLIEDPVMNRVESLLKRAPTGTELQVVRYAA